MLGMQRHTTQRHAAARKWHSLVLRGTSPRRHRVLIRLSGRLALPLEHAHQVGQRRKVGAVDAHEGAIRDGDELMPRVAYIVYGGAAVEAAVRLGLEAN
jgi:hypothetical protein